MKVCIGPFPDNGNEKRHIDIHVDPYDAWNADHTLALIIVPVLKELKKGLHGCPIDFCTLAEDGYTVLDSDEACARWELAIDKMIWAFQQVVDDNEDDFWIQKGEWDFEDAVSEEDREGLPDDEPVSRLKWIVEPIRNDDAYYAYMDRMQEGFDLFGKYFRNLWD